MDRRRKIAVVAGASALAVAGVAAVMAWRRSATAMPVAAPGCRLQGPQDFLVRSNYLKDPTLFQRAVEYRTRQYGYFPGFGTPDMNAHPPSYYAVATTFMGLPVTMNRKVAAVLKCVEQEILRTCGTSYKPTALSGLRSYNSYHGFEVSNHVYGIAIDIDPDLNPCCHCWGHWQNDPKCQIPYVYDRMAMPRCWIDVFERYGFYWLGHDVLQDTMHFEFLGEPPDVTVPYRPTSQIPQVTPVVFEE